MSTRGIAIGGVALALTLACSAIVWLGTTTPAIDDTVREGILLSRTALDDVVANVKDDGFVCPYAVLGELMEASDLGRVYRVSCATQRKDQPPARFRITVRPYLTPTVEPW